MIIATAVAVVPIPVLVTASGVGSVTVGAVVNPPPLAVTVTIPNVPSAANAVPAAPVPVVASKCYSGYVVVAYPAPGFTILTA